MGEAASLPTHHFWPDAINRLTPGLMAGRQLLTGSHITEAYLLALMVKVVGNLLLWTRSLRRLPFKTRKALIWRFSTRKFTNRDASPALSAEGFCLCYHPFNN